MRSAMSSMRRLTLPVPGRVSSRTVVARRHVFPEYVGLASEPQRMRCSRRGTGTSPHLQLRADLRERPVAEVSHLLRRHAGLVPRLAVPLAGEPADDQRGLLARDAQLPDE